jgi:hypothetical protein
MELVWGEEGDVKIVICAMGVICSSRECIWLPHRATWSMMEFKVEAGEKEGPASLSPV